MALHHPLVRRRAPARRGELARRHGVYDRAIHTADRTRGCTTSPALSDAVPGSVPRLCAAAHGVDEAWVLGLVRQESRFNTEARSSAGAGIMQVMPRTALRGQIGMRNYRPKTVTEIETNVTLGTGIQAR